MASLISLPNELLHTICYYTQFEGLPKAASNDLLCATVNKTLLQLCRSCRVLNDVAQNILYNSILGKRDVHGSLLPLWRLTETILTRPSLAEKVKTLSIQLNPQASIDLEAREVKSATNVSLLLSSTLVERTPTTLWAYELLHILCLHLPHLATLRITLVDFDPKTSEDETSAELLSRIQDFRNPKAPHNLTVQRHSNLKFFEVTYEKIQSYNPTIHAGEYQFTVYIAPSLETVNITRRQHIRLSSMSSAPAQTPTPPIAPNLTSIELREYCIDHAILAAVLKTTTHLTRFVYTTLDPLTLHRGSLLGRPQLDGSNLVRPPTPTQLLTALSCRAATLLELEVDVYDWFQPGHDALWEHDGTDPRQRYASFAHFARLQVLNIEHERLCAPRELPASLVALTLTHRPNKPCLMDDPLHFPRCEQRFRMLITQGVCPGLRYVRMGRFYPFRFKGERLYDWMSISEDKWEAFVSDAVEFSDPVQEGRWVAGGEAVRKTQDTWWDVWWGSWLSEAWPEGLEEELIQCLFREVARS
ncbi:hypothetical protein IQ07DRAFT_646677 [Pyrenochaeta sp. DS3sAY3a]|nr:hypothetical protein IQ07DRAFT_646677 [Pyrenochaeta sp. DS3sAY3a]